ncbi:hypothetical protein GRF59_01230 [Paenibacillus sp. HJL G12]|uniref:Nucleic acid-binding protein n=1 Tax=Paenibacillus dendrobii TaxID=2691084 RepID=A0A7X3IGT4_9BACL|nr:hypothetical protein [Paenibacillus dendrobii]MWV42240.1 hypothetical protein [Paenibacillus dendrobii]
MKEKEINCLRCQEKMTQVDNISKVGEAGLVITKSTGFFKSKMSRVLPFVCPSCGHIELFAVDNPSQFYDL